MLYQDMRKSVDIACTDCLVSHRESDYRMMADLYKKHVGQPGFVLGNGRSLANVNFAALEGHITIACNRIFRYVPTFKPTYYGTTEITVAISKLLEEEAYRVPTMFFCRDTFNAEALDDSIKHWVRIHAPPSMSERLIISGLLPDKDTQHFVGGLGGTVPGFSIQMAYWLGCNPIVLLGVDADSRGHVYDLATGGDRMSSDAQITLIHEVEALSKSLNKKNVSLLNASSEGQLTIPRVDMGAFLTCNIVGYK